nr:PREDICTED: DNA excision repair protein ERCC-6-like 2 [Struthio camelus australis]
MCNDAPDRWYIGNKCLASCLGNGKLYEGTITPIEKDKDEKSFAVVSFLESEERKILIAKLHSLSQKRSLELPSPAVAFNLSENGDCILYMINRYLCDYQREGAQFLYGHYVNKRGCVLGDDMGLGKTTVWFFFFFFNGYIERMDSFFRSKLSVRCKKKK